MYIVINDDKVIYKSSLKKLNKKLNTNFSSEEFKKFNHDFVLNVTNDDLTYQKDMNALNNVFVQKLYKKDNTLMILSFLLIVLMIFQLVSISKISNLESVIQTVLDFMTKKFV